GPGHPARRRRNRRADLVDGRRRGAPHPARRRRIATTGVARSGHAAQGIGTDPAVARRPDAIMAAMPTKTPDESAADAAAGNGTSAVARVEHAASSWGLGDGAAIPWEYAPAPESRDVVTVKDRYGLFINGREVQASDGATFPDVNPATEEQLTVVAKATAQDIDTAVRAARNA